MANTTASLAPLSLQQIRLPSTPASSDQGAIPVDAYHVTAPSKVARVNNDPARGGRPRDDVWSLVEVDEDNSV
ncbi:hypothetical protein ON010_g10678 [Phytophthora cinnamomi]|nr:hypothetical protein ON010_g10678 [Phytophthora cinnamomi]